ncbi:MAG: UDP-N-acetylenolpyruvoylglucosamine reductase [Patescibacteria group bacterium]|nr:UDP-N-acetylmuramate dehydrogenase [Candidatus Saccharibacteria bacterium]MDQ5963246.1 UDP-N-acetylenolpyruvoylglucosamine reductase [Patescibacteria group bacterium]
MNIQKNVPLSQHSTMRLGGEAAFLVTITTRSELKEAVQWARENQKPLMVIGDGSNIVWQDEGFDGLIIVNKITRFETYVEDARSHYITVGAGENWDSVVRRSVEAGLTGIEALSLIPGTAGATPVQNVGAYGQEVSQSIMSVEVYDCQTDQFANVPSELCGFAYRKSNFQTEFRGRYIISAVTFHLWADNPKPPFYRAVQQYLDENQFAGIVTPKVIREAVIKIRQSKLPDPAKVANCGSFFGNPIVTSIELSDLRANFPEMPCWPLDDGGAKIPAAWLIEHAGYKDFHDQATGMATWAKQPLVLVNERARSTADLLAFKTQLVGAVRSKFGITLTQEPELLPHIDQPSA